MRWSVSPLLQYITRPVFVPNPKRTLHYSEQAFAQSCTVQMRGELKYVGSMSSNVCRCSFWGSFFSQPYCLLSHHCNQTKTIFSLSLPSRNKKGPPAKMYSLTTQK
jgi:hypothetical protein